VPARPAHLTTAERIAAATVTAPAAAIVSAYLIDRAGITLHPAAILIVSLVAGAAWLRKGDSDAGEAFGFLGVTAVVGAALMLAAWPSLLPPGAGSDLTHHLQLISFIERHWRLPHDPGTIELIGGMVNYTPGSHLLAALAGAWSGTDGLRAMYPLLAAVSAIKAGLVFLIARRLPPDDAARLPTAIAAVALLAIPYDYSLGSVFRWSFFAQVVAEMFAAAMWWALVIWQRQPRAAAWLFGIAGAGAFLCWPVWVGPPALALGVLLLARTDVALRDRLGAAAIAAAPIAVVAALHASGRVESLSIVQSGGAAFEWSPARFGWLLLVAAAAGVTMAWTRTEARATLVVLAATLVQAASLFGLAHAGGADSPYLARKMAHFAVLPMAALAALPLAALCRRLARASFTPERILAPIAWTVAAIVAASAARTIAGMPRPAPAIDGDLARAGGWARDHVPIGCVDYLVRSDDTSYWLHHAALGNRMHQRPGGPRPQFSYRVVVERWIAGGGQRYAIAGLARVPREIREDLEPLAQFGSILVGRRRAGGACGAGSDYAVGSGTIAPSKR
jgi:hypothetical protein